MALRPGASLLLVSRGVVEAAYKREEFGLNRVKEQFQGASGDNAREIATVILDGVQQFAHTLPTHNDVTALALVRADCGVVSRYADRLPGRRWLTTLLGISPG